MTIGGFGSTPLGQSPLGGTPPASFGVVAVELLSPTVLRVTFTADLDVTYAALVRPNNYVLSPLRIVRAVTVESADSVLLTTDRLVAGAYTVTVQNAQGYWGQTLDPSLASASFSSEASLVSQQVRVPLSAFSGQLQNDPLLGSKSSVFFSPALTTAVANTTIRVDEIDACTFAFDQYVPPPDRMIGKPFIVYGDEGRWSRLNSSDVLWAGPTGQSDFTISYGYREAGPVAADGPANSALVDTWELDKVALLNNVGWSLQSAGGGVRLFITADNRTPIPRNIVHDERTLEPSV